MQTLQRQIERAEEEGKTERLADLEAEIRLPPFPEALGYIWHAYLRLRRRMPMGFSSANPIGWQDIDAFISRSGLSLAPWEIEMLERLDDIFLNPDAGVQSAKGREMTPELFDTLFK